MKTFLKIGLIIICLFITSHLFSQNFISEDKKWSIVSKIYSEDDIDRKVTTSLKFLGDTTIQETSFKKLYSSDDKLKENWTLHSLWFERNDSIFSRSVWYEGNKLEYDFTLSEKDTFTIYKDNLYLIVDSIRTKVWGNKEREFFYFHSPLSYNIQTVWIKGVGQLGYMPRSTEIGISGASCSLLCFEEDNELVYQNPEYNSCSVFTSITTMKNEPDFVEVYNPGENLIIINPLSTNRGIIQIFNISGYQIIQEEVDLKETQICLPISGAYIYRFISKTGEVQNGKIIVN